jgi:hypothetical protein
MIIVKQRSKARWTPISYGYDGGRRRRFFFVNSNMYRTSYGYVYLVVSLCISRTVKVWVKVQNKSIIFFAFVQTIIVGGYSLAGAAVTSIDRPANKFFNSPL